MKGSGLVQSMSAIR